MLDHSNKFNAAAYMCLLAHFELSLFGSTPLMSQMEISK